MISGKNISWKFKHKKKSSHTLKQVSFELKQGRITTFMGQSGAGKTTLLKCIANLQSEYEGLITCNGVDLKALTPSERASTIGFVPQHFHLFPHLTVLQNCTHALTEVLKVKKAEALERALETLTQFNMDSFIHSFPAQLSGGQQQRVAIARALLLQPEVLILDEPTSALDPESKKLLETLLLNLNAKGVTFALSSHDMPFIRRIMDYIYFLEGGAIVEAWDRQTEELESKDKIKQFLAHA